MVSWWLTLKIGRSHLSEPQFLFLSFPVTSVRLLIQFAIEVLPQFPVLMFGVIDPRVLFPVVVVFRDRFQLFSYCMDMIVIENEFKPLFLQIAC